MPEGAASSFLNTEVKLEGIALHQLRYTDRRSDLEDGTGANIRFFLSAVLFADRQFGVEFGINMRAKEFRLRAAYRMVFSRADSAPDELSEIAFAQFTAARLAPVIAFPYIRSLVSLVTANSGEAVVLPITNVGAMFTPDQVDVGFLEEPEPMPPAKVTRPGVTKGTGRGTRKRKA